MPFAPSPIQIRYDSPGQLGSLAAASGQAIAGRNEYRDWLQRRAMDDELVASVRAQQNTGTAMKYQEEQALNAQPFRLQQAYAPRGRAQMAGSVTSTAGKNLSPLRMAMDQSRLEGSNLRNERLRGKLAAPDMVPVTGPIDGPEGSMSINVRQGGMGPPAPDEEGWNMGPSQPRGVYPGGDKAAMVPLQVRRTMDTIDALPKLDAESKEALKLAVRNGLPMEQAFIEARALSEKPQPKNAMQKASDKARVAMLGLDAALAQGPESAHRFLMTLYPNDYRLMRLKGDAVLQMAGQERSRLQSFIDSAGGPPVQVQTPEDAMKLPSGTRFVTPDGRVKVRP